MALFHYIPSISQFHLIPFGVIDIRNSIEEDGIIDIRDVIYSLSLSIYGKLRNYHIIIEKLK